MNQDSQSIWILTFLTMTMHSPERLPVLSSLLLELTGLLGLYRLSSANRAPLPIREGTPKYNEIEGKKQTKVNQ